MQSLSNDNNIDKIQEVLIYSQHNDDKTKNKLWIFLALVLADIHSHFNNISAQRLDLLWCGFRRQVLNEQGLLLFTH